MQESVHVRIPRTRLRAVLAAGAAGAVVAVGLWGVPAQAGGAGRATSGAADRSAADRCGVGGWAKVPFLRAPRGRRGTTCTATVVAASSDPEPSHKALIVSNGHCVRDTLGTNEVLIDRPVPEDEQQWTFTPAYFHDNTTEQKTFDVERIAYATMKDIDVSVLQLSATYADLAQLNVLPRTLSSAGVPAEGTRLQAAHAPSDGMPEGEDFLRLSNCQATGSGIALHEHTWLWRGFARTDCRGISGGSSGGAVTTAQGDQLVGMINTVSTPGYLGCGLGRPCEGSAQGLVIPADDTVYVTPVDALASCLDEAGLRLNRPGCRLDAGRQVTLEFTGQQTQSDTPQGPAHWDVHATAGQDDGHAYVAFKTGPFGTTDCTKREGYSRPQPLGTPGADYRELLPRQDNLYILCAAGGPSPAVRGAGWSASLAHPSHAYARVDNTPPTVQPSLSVQRFGEGADASYRVYPVYQPWEITSYKVKYGPKDTTDCADPRDYHFYRNVPALLQESQGPWTYCAIGHDNADNATAPKAFEIG
ncbi:trypsin-like peptidase domain-containing protein [Streptomyces sp. NPDC090442]|uniref:trypsin-like peptidase domain-containing protein n=1 Tax=Streptomyces sp. NPDC090442 TaxID=3365962 RepID=UPI00382007C7